MGARLKNLFFSELFWLFLCTATSLIFFSPLRSIRPLLCGRPIKIMTIMFTLLLFTRIWRVRRGWVMFEKFHFKKFSPSEDVVLYANSMLTQIMDLAPDNSNCYASVTRMGDMYSAWLEITSPEKAFAAHARAEDPRLAVDLLEDRIKLKIRKWQTTRKMPSSDWLSLASGT
jgi:ribosome-associated translation inhibitor RaiA